jgi:hypothetical protein
MRSKKSIEARLEDLEEATGHLIDDLADFVRWEAAGCPDSWRWDPKFERQMAEMAKEISDGAICE